MLNIYLASVFSVLYVVIAAFAIYAGVAFSRLLDNPLMGIPFFTLSGVGIALIPAMWVMI